MLNIKYIVTISLSSVSIIIGTILYWNRVGRKKDSNYESDDTKLANDTNRLETSAPSPPADIDSLTALDNPMCSPHSSRSAPIDIQSKGSPKFTNQEFDAELLKLKIQKTDLQNLKSIQEEDDINSLVENHKDFPFNSFSDEIRPVIVKASSKVSEGIFISVYSKDDKKCKYIDGKNSPELHEADIDIHPKHADTHQALHTSSFSPPLSAYSVHSEDSGKGSSPSQSLLDSLTIKYSFYLPFYLVSSMVGRKGFFADKIKNSSGARISIKRSQSLSKTRTCTLEGTQKEIEAALCLIRKRFPLKKYPTLSLQRIADECSSVNLTLLNTNFLQLNLIEGINNDCLVSAITEDRIFLQQPLHPSYCLLHDLQCNMNESYSRIEAPLLTDVVENIICIANVKENWVRVQTISHSIDCCVVKNLDYGGYISVPLKNLRQIRTEFMALPFQAIEVCLANIKPYNGKSWSKEAVDVIYGLTSNTIVQVQIAGYTTQKIPQINIYATLNKKNVVSINQELLARKFAKN